MVSYVKGFTPSRKADGGISNFGRKRGLIRNSYATAIYKGDPVISSAGFIKLGVNGTSVIGVFDGAKYVDTNNRTTESDYVAANTSSQGTLEGQIHILAYYIPAKGNYFTIPADSSVNLSVLGKLYPVSIGSGNTVYRRSACVMNVSVQGATSAMVRVVSLPQKILNVNGDNSTLVEVEFFAAGPSV